MGISGVSPGSLILLIIIFAMLFGTKRLRTIGEDLGAAVRSFKRGLETEREDKKDDLH